MNYLVVFDTVALLQSTISPTGAAARCFSYFEQGKISVAVSRATLQEVKNVLSRPQIRQRFPHLTDEKVTWLVDFLLDEGLYLRTVETFPLSTRSQRRTPVKLGNRSESRLPHQPRLRSA